jgi:putative addiction module killer protein
MFSPHSNQKPARATRIRNFKLDWKLQNIVISRLNRIKTANFGNCESVRDKVFELKIHVGAGYIIYFAKERGRLILMLCAGDKSSQKTDIKKAKTYLKKYHEQKNQKNI